MRGADFQQVKAQYSQSAPTFVLNNGEDFIVNQGRPVLDTRLKRMEAKKL